MQTLTTHAASTRRIRTKVTAMSAALVAAGTGAVGVGVMTASPADAACNGGDRAQMVNTFRGDHHLQGSARVSNVSGGRERWCDIRTYEGGGSSVFPNVCSYQGQVAVYNPAGDYADRIHTSSYHSGCSFSGWFYHDPLDGIYAENKRFKTKWRSDATGGGFVDIGTLVD